MHNTASSDCFCSILNYAMDQYAVNATRLSELLNDAGENVSRKRISAYMNAERTPKFERAKMMLSVLSYPISDSELKDSLEKNREYIKDETNFELRGINKSILLKYKNILPERPPEEVGILLDERIEMLFGDRKCFSAYIQKLIGKDLREYILSKEEVIGDNE